MTDEIVAFRIGKDTTLRIRKDKIVATHTWNFENSNTKKVEIYVAGIEEPFVVRLDQSAETEIWN
jgi:hypothetical protein